MKKILVPFIILSLLFSIVPVALGEFEDQPQPGKWVYENFLVLQNSGLLKGYPDDTFRGENKATRYEMVELTARVLRYLEEKMASSFQDKIYLDEETVKDLIADAIIDREHSDDVYQALTSLEKEFKDELAAQDLRVTTLEEDVAALKLKVKDLEKEAKNAKLMAIAGIVLGLIGAAK